MRLFLAFPVPGEVASRLEEALSPLHRKLSRILGRALKWVPWDNYHVTIKFLGDTEPSTMEGFLPELEKLALDLSPFQTSFKDIGFFPIIGAPRVMWLSLSFPERVLSFQDRFEELFEKFGYEREKRKFIPHMTLARFSRLNSDQIRDLRRAVESFSAKKASEFSIEFEVKSFVLFKSELTPDGAVYTPVKIFPLV